MAEMRLVANRVALGVTSDRPVFVRKRALVKWWFLTNLMTSRLRLMMSAAHGCFAMSFIRRSTACAQHFMPVNLHKSNGGG